MSASPHSELRSLMTGIAFAATFVIVGVWMMLAPDALSGGPPQPPGGGAGGGVGEVFALIWSFPGGVVCVLLGLMIAARLIYLARR